MAGPPHRLVRFIVATAATRGIPLTKLSTQTGLSRGALGKYARGEHEPSITHIDRVLRALGYRMTIEPVSLEQDE